MRKQSGFTLLELMVTVLIVGVLSATAIPLYHTWMQRAYGTEATLMMKQIMDGEIMYYLEHDNFFPQGAGSLFQINADGSTTPSPPADTLSQIKKALKVAIPTGHHLQYDIINTSDPNGKKITVRISSENNSFALFNNGDSFLRATLDSQGKVAFF